MSGTSLGRGGWRWWRELSQDGALQFWSRQQPHAAPTCAMSCWRLNSRQGQDELHRAALAGNAMAAAYAQVVQQLLQATGLGAASHAPPSGPMAKQCATSPGAHDGTGYTLQLHQSGPAGRAHRHHGGGRLAQSRCGRRRRKALPWCRPFTSRSLPHLRGHRA